MSRYASFLPGGTGINPSMYVMKATPLLCFSAAAGRIDSAEEKRSLDHIACRSGRGSLVCMVSDGSATAVQRGRQRRLYDQLLCIWDGTALRTGPGARSARALGSRGSAASVPYHPDRSR